MGVAASGIVINGLSAWLLHAGSHGDLNRRSAFIHMLGDALISVGVLVSGALIVFTGWSRLDPIVSLLIVAAILVSTWGLLRDSLHLSLDGVPASVNSSAVMSYLADQQGVTDVHDLHIWAMSTTEVAMTVHLVRPGAALDDGLLAQARHELQERFGVCHVTLQIEIGDPAHPCSLAPAEVV